MKILAFLWISTRQHRFEGGHKAYRTAPARPSASNFFVQREINQSTHIAIRKTASSPLDRPGHLSPAQLSVALGAIQEPVPMASTQQPSPSQPMVVSTPSGKNRVMPTTASAASASGAGQAGASVAPTPSGSSGMGTNPQATAVAMSMSLTPNGSQTNQDLASLFECPVCFDYVLPPILQVRF